MGRIKLVCAYICLRFEWIMRAHSTWEIYGTLDVEIVEKNKNKSVIARFLRCACRRRRMFLHNIIHTFRIIFILNNEEMNYISKRHLFQLLCAMNRINGNKLVIVCQIYFPLMTMNRSFFAKLKFWFQKIIF